MIKLLHQLQRDYAERVTRQSKANSEKLPNWLIKMFTLSWCRWLLHTQEVQREMHFGSLNGSVNVGGLCSEVAI